MNTTTKLQKILQKKTDSLIEEQETILESAKLLLSSNEAEEKNVLNSIGLNRELEHFEGIAGSVKFRKKLAEKYKSLIVSTEELTQFCKDYGLIIREPRSYVGKMPNDCGAVLNRFIKENKIPIASNHAYNKDQFKIVAPPSMFEGYRNPMKEVFSEFKTLPDVALENFKKSTQPDPMLIYKLEEGNWAIIQSWGNDQTITRRAVGFFFSSGMYTFLHQLFWLLAGPVLFFGGVYVIHCILHSLLYLNNNSFVENSDKNFIYIIIITFSTVIALALSLGYIFNSKYYPKLSRIIKEQNISENVW